MVVCICFLEIFDFSNTFPLLKIRQKTDYIKR